jgi:hypothetical protein
MNLSYGLWKPSKRLGVWHPGSFDVEFEGVQAAVLSADHMHGQPCSLPLSFSETVVRNHATQANSTSAQQTHDVSCLGCFHCAIANAVWGFGCLAGRFSLVALGRLIVHSLCLLLSFTGTRHDAC